MDLATFLIQLLNGIQYGLLLFLVASGLTLLFGVMGIINLAHGSFYTLGAYLAFSLAERTGGLAAAFALGVPLCALLGIILERTLFRRLRDGDHLGQVLMTYGLVLVIDEARSILWGDDVHGVAVPAWLNFSIPLTDTLSYPAYRLAMSAACLIIAAAMYLVLRHTRLGMALRAGIANREMAQSLGIDVGQVCQLVFALGVALACFAGMLAAPVSSVFPSLGSQLLILCFVVVVVGGLGSVWGALAAALLIGVVDTLGRVVLPQGAGVSVYLLMAVILVWRPQGLVAR